MKKRYVVRLTSDEREQLDALVHKGRAAAHKRRHAELLLLVDQGVHGPGHPDSVAAERVGVCRHTVANVRQRCVLEGLESALERRKRSRERSRVLDGDGEAQLLALVCGPPPAGRARWTLHLLCDELRARQVVVSISHEAVRQVLKKHHQTLASADVVHPAPRRRGVRVRDGAGAGGVQTSS